MYVRDSQIIVLRPGQHGRDHATERFSAGGEVEKDLLPLDGEIRLHRIVLPVSFPETIIGALPGKKVREVVEVPKQIQGACPRRGCDHAGDTLHRIADHRIVGARHVERGTMLIVEAKPGDGMGRYQ